MTSAQYTEIILNWWIIITCMPRKIIHSVGICCKFSLYIWRCVLTVMECDFLMKEDSWQKYAGVPDPCKNCKCIVMTLLSAWLAQNPRTTFYFTKQLPVHTDRVIIYIFICQTNQFTTVKEKKADRYIYTCIWYSFDKFLWSNFKNHLQKEHLQILVWYQQICIEIYIINKDLPNTLLRFNLSLATCEII